MQLDPVLRELLIKKSLWNIAMQELIVSKPSASDFFEALCKVSPKITQGELAEAKLQLMRDYCSSMK